MRVPSGLKAALLTDDSWPSRRASTVPLRASHTRAVLSAVADDAVTMPPFRALYGAPQHQSKRPSQLTRQAVNYIVRMAGETAKLGRVWPHMLRHSCGYCLADKGTDLRTMQDYLGHRDPKHTEHYTRVAWHRRPPTERAAAAAQWRDHESDVKPCQRRQQARAVDMTRKEARVSRPCCTQSTACLRTLNPWF